MYDLLKIFLNYPKVSEKLLPYKKAINYTKPMGNLLNIPWNGEKIYNSKDTLAKKF